MKKYIKSNATDPNYEPDIVLYVNNRRIYKGSPYSYELGYELTKLCINTNVRESFIDWLVEIGLSADEFVYDETTPVDYMAQDVAGAVVDEIIFEYSEREDFYIDGMGCINLECFLAEDEVVANTKIMGSSWRAPNGKSYGKQTKRFPGKYLFTRKELKDMVDSGIAQDLGGTFNSMSMNYDIIGISWNETNGYRSGILIVDKDTGELYVGNSADANVAKL